MQFGAKPELFSGYWSQVTGFWSVKPYTNLGNKVLDKDPSNRPI